MFDKRLSILVLEDAEHMEWSHFLQFRNIIEKRRNDIGSRIVTVWGCLQLFFVVRNCHNLTVYVWNCVLVSRARCLTQDRTKSCSQREWTSESLSPQTSHRVNTKVSWKQKRKTSECGYVPVFLNFLIVQWNLSLTTTPRD